MVLDISGSVQGDRLTALKAGALSVIDRLRRDDRAALVSFSHRLDLPSALTADRETLRQAVSGLAANGSTALRDAAYAGLALRGADSARTLLLLFSDGLDNSSILDEARVLAVARRSDAIVYAIGVRETAKFNRLRQVVEDPLPTDDRFLTTLARETGGRLLHAEQHRDIERTFTRVFEEFNSRYVLGYRRKACRRPAGTRWTCGSRPGAEPSWRGGATSGAASGTRPRYPAASGENASWQPVVHLEPGF